METTEEKKEDKKAEPVSPPVEEKKEESKNGKAEEEAKKAERTAKILAEGKRLYRHFSEAGFKRDSFIELGESIKAGKTFEQLHPVVARLILRVGAKLVDGE